MIYQTVILLITMCCLGLPVQAQSDSSLVEAEKAFAALANKTTFRNAFLVNLDSTGVIFHKGQILNGLKQFSAAPEDRGKLLWHPAFACTSQSGELGFTTGPFEYREEEGAPVQNAGQYSSIWRRNGHGEWKLLVDLGIEFDSSMYVATIATKLCSERLLVKSAGKKNTIEADFVQKYNQESILAFEDKIFDESWFNMQGKQPLVTKTAILKGLRELPARMNFEPAYFEESAAGDFICVYGYVLLAGTRENYLRVWVHTSDGWKIILQAIRY